MNPSAVGPSPYGVWGGYGSEVPDILRDGHTSMHMHPHDVPSEDFLGVTPWLDHEVDSSSFLADCSVDPLTTMSKQSQPYSIPAPMLSNSSMMVYSSVPEHVPAVYPYVQAALPMPTSDGPTSPSAGSHSLQDTSSSSSPASPSSPPPPSTNSASLSVELLHKPRGSAGQWRTIVGKQRVRVTHGRGKNMRMHVRSTIEPNWDTFKLTLLEKDEDVWLEAPEDMFSVETRRPMDETIDGVAYWVLQLDIKLFAIHKLVAFKAEVASMDGVVSSSISAVMSTHNSGRRDVRGRDDEDGEDMDDHEEEPPPRREKKSKRLAQDRDSRSPDATSDSAVPPAKQAKTNLVQTPSAASARSAPNPPPAHTESAPVAAAAVTSHPQQHQHMYQVSPPRYPPQTLPDPTTQPWQTVAGNLQVDGVVRARAFLQYSDIRLKTDITEITDALNIVCSLKGKTYKWKKDIENPAAGQTGGQRVIGLIAQEVQKVLPEVVMEKDGYLSVNYVEIIPVLVEAFKQHLKDFDTFKGGVESNIRDMKEDMAALGALTSKLQLQQDLPEEEVLQELDGMSKHVLRMQEILRSRRAGSPNVAVVPDVTGPFLHKKPIEDLAASSADSSATVSTSSSAEASISSDASDTRLLKAYEKPRVLVEPSTAAPLPKEPVAVHVHVVSNDNTWKIIAGILAVVILLGAVVGLVLGLRAPASPTPDTTTWSPNVLSNPSFETIDTNGKAAEWLGNYDLVVFSAKKRGLRDNPVLPCDANSSVECWDSVPKSAWSKVSEVRPDVGNVVMLLSLLSYADSNTALPAYAKQIIAPYPLPPAGSIKMLNVSAKALGEFVFPELPKNSSFTSAVFELDVFVKYVGLPTKDLTRIQFKPHQPMWQSISTLISVRSQYQVQYVELQPYQTAVGNSFWDDITLSYLAL